LARSVGSATFCFFHIPPKRGSVRCNRACGRLAKPSYCPCASARTKRRRRDGRPARRAEVVRTQIAPRWLDIRHNLQSATPWRRLSTCHCMMVLSPPTLGFKKMEERMRALVACGLSPIDTRLVGNPHKNQDDRDYTDDHGQTVHCPARHVHKAERRWSAARGH
jgi:hypothetical protein